MRFTLAFLIGLMLVLGCSQMGPDESPTSAFRKLQSGLESVAPADRQEYATRCINFAEANDNEQIGVDALLWITRCNRRSIGFQQANDRAIERLLTEHISRHETETAVFEMPGARSPKTIENLRTLLVCENETIRGLASYSLAVRLKGLDDKSESISLLEKVIRDHSDVKATKGSQLVALRPLAEQCLFEIHELQIGMPAPTTNRLLTCSSRNCGCVAPLGIGG